MRGISFPLGGRLTVARNASQIITLGPLRPKYHVVRGLLLSIVADAAVTAGDYLQFAVRRFSQKPTTATIFNTGKPIIAGDANDVNSAGRIDAALKSLYVPLNYTPHDGGDLLVAAYLECISAAVNIAGFFAWDVMPGEWLLGDSRADSPVSAALGHGPAGNV